MVVATVLLGSWTTSLPADFYHNPLFNGDPEEKIEYWVEESRRSYEVSDAGAAEGAPMIPPTGAGDILAALEALKKNKERTAEHYKNRDPNRSKQLLKDVKLIDQDLEALADLIEQSRRLAERAETSGMGDDLLELFTGTGFLQRPPYNYWLPYGEIRHKFGIQIDRLRRILVLRQTWLDADETEEGRQQAEKKLRFMMGRLKRKTLGEANRKLTENLVDNIKYLTMKNIKPSEFPRYPKDKWKEPLLKSYIKRFKRLLKDNAKHVADQCIEALADYWAGRPDRHATFGITPRRDFATNLEEIILEGGRDAVVPLVEAILEEPDNKSRGRLRDLLRKLEPRGTPSPIVLVTNGHDGCKSGATTSTRRNVSNETLFVSTLLTL